ncbi:MAG: hypothetical protein GC166_06325 [Alphaproteobacteria bacterium]|nr:hypothetical protein [Alphaproteobacteria bacterium]
MIRREARREGASAWMALALGLLPLLLPSMTAQAQLGMENAPFAFALLAFLQAWKNRTAKTPTGLMLALGLPALFFFRPEAVLLGGGIGLVILANRDWKNLGYILLGGAIAGTIYFMIEWATGAPLQAAGELRAEISRISSIAVSLGASTIYLNPKPIIAIAYTSPFALLLFFHRKRVVRDEWIMLFALYLLPLILHVLNVFPSVHFSRYFMYAYAAFFYVFARVMARKPATTAHAAAVAAAALLIGVTLVPYEQFTRSMQGRSLARDTIAALDPAFKKTMSEGYFELLGHPATPIVVATVEPQSRLFLDDRFVLRSLDGIVDYKLGAFVREGWIDYLGYLKSRHVDFIVSYPAYSRDPNHFRLPDVIEGGGDYARDGVCFHRLGMMPQLRFLQPVYAVHYGTACQAARR